MDKSFVTICTRHCVKCNKKYETNELMMDTRIENGNMRETFDRYTCVGLGCCPDCVNELKTNRQILIFDIIDKDYGTEIRSLICKEEMADAFNGPKSETNVYQFTNELMDEIFRDYEQYKQTTTQSA